MKWNLNEKAYLLAIRACEEDPTIFNFTTVDPSNIEKIRNPSQYMNSFVCGGNSPKSFAYGGGSVLLIMKG